MALLKVYDDIMNENDAVGFFGDKQDAFTASRLTDFLQDTPDTEIEGHLHCRGGSVSEGYTCHDLLTHSGKKITMIVDGICASISTVVLMAAPKESRKMNPNAQLLIHEPYIPEYTLADSYTSADLSKMAMQLEGETNRLVDFYVQNTGADREELMNLVKAETYLNATEALRLGFVGEILQPTSNSFKDKFKTNHTMENKELNAAMAKNESILNKLLKFVGFNPDAVNMDMTDATGAKFTIEKEAGDPIVGDVASPDGVYTMEDGTIITIAGGVITEITVAEPQMDAKDKEIADLKAEIETLKGANAAALDAEKAELTAKLIEAIDAIAKAKALHVELSAVKSKFFPENRQNNEEEPKESEMAKKVRLKKAEIEARAKK